ncbi:MAG: ABC transporter substrate-binding protein [Sandaracinaceae bacterium]
MRTPTLALAACALVVGGCSLTRAERVRCEVDADCQQVFGVGFACRAEDGFCVDAPPFARCDRTFPTTLRGNPDEFGDAFVIGAIADESLSGHQARQRSVELAAIEVEDEVEREGALMGRPVGVVFCTNEENSDFDDLSIDDASATIAQYLVEDIGVAAIVGPPSSDSTRRVFEVAEPEGVLVISPSATAPGLTDLEDPPSDDQPGLLWRTAPPDSFQGRAIALDMQGRGVEAVGVIVERSDYGSGLVEVFTSHFVGEGRTAERFEFDAGSAPQRNAAVNAAAADRFEEVLFVSSQTSDASGFILFAESLAAYQDRGIFLTDSARNGDFLTGAENGRGLFPQIRGTFPAEPDSMTFMAFTGAYQAQFDDDAALSSFTAHAYDAAWLVFIGAAWAVLQEDGAAGRALARGLRNVSSGDDIALGPGALAPIADAFQDGSSVDLEGASGDLDYSAEDEELRAPTQVWMINAAGDGFDTVATIDP